MAFSLYIHIPFCVQKCRYCDFYSLGQSAAVPDAYVDALLRELAVWQARFGRQTPQTVYFGGGTPSLLHPEQVARLLEAASPAPGAEVTLETNPGTVSRDRLAAFRAAGVNRLSVGVQTADDASLRRLGRIHTALQSKTTLQDAAAAGFTNVSGDVMLALPHYTRKELHDTLTLLTEGGVTHISSYLLKIEPGTPFGRTPPEGLPDEDAAAAFYLACVEECEALGYAQYEISNFARPGFESRHNLCYWDCGDYLGLGPAAHSCVGGKRFYYPSNIDEFIQKGATVPDGECTAQDLIMLQLRLKKGLSLAALRRDWDTGFTDGQMAFLRRCAAGGLLTLDGDTVRLTPRGMLVQNSILCELI